jgi:hypothetical protein
VIDRVNLTEQYKTPNNVQVRADLHARFSTNPYGFHRWAFDQYEFPEGARILELGCGLGDLWWENRDRILPDWQAALSDFSMGMLRPCHGTWRTRLACSSTCNVKYRVVGSMRRPTASCICENWWIWSHSLTRHSL